MVRHTVQLKLEVIFYERGKEPGLHLMVYIIHNCMENAQNIAPRNNHRTPMMNINIWYKKYKLFFRSPEEGETVVKNGFQSKNMSAQSVRDSVLNYQHNIFFQIHI